MANQETRRILVYAGWYGHSSDRLIGELKVQRVRSKEIFAFEYSHEWLKDPGCQLLDPDLQLYGGRQYVQEPKPNFGIFLDSSPDRWGRMLMRRRESMLARQEGRAPGLLLESDYLLGVYDKYRMGGIRYKTDEDSEYLNSQVGPAVPPWSSLQDLEYASQVIEHEDIEGEKETTCKWLNMLIAPGSSLGGARPKSGVYDKEQQQWIAKFPSVNDEFDIGSWEMVLNHLAEKSGITVPEARIMRLSGRYHTYLSKRFDRTADGERIHLASAMTMLGRLDGDHASEGISYLDLAGFIMRNSPNPNQDLIQLWRRIVFNILVSNTDDHLRNHAFIFNQSGWSLSPAFDMNPNPWGGGLSLNISEDDNTQDIELAMSVAKYFQLPGKEASKIAQEIHLAVRQWSKVALHIQIPVAEIERMRGAFKV
ncbi:MAG: HipA domain-containing protein [Bacteroidales bacterium]